MARSAIFLSLIVATLVGPCLCCCAMASVLANPVAATTAPIQANGPACPHCQPRSSGVSDESGDKSPKKRDCPCCESRRHRVLIAPTAPTFVTDDVEFVGIIAIEDVLVVAHVDRNFRVESPRGIGTAAFLIDFCHRLRC